VQEDAAPPWRSLVGRGLGGRSFSSSSKRKWLSARGGTGPRRAAETKLSKGEAAAKQASCKRRDVERNTWKVGSAVAGEGEGGGEECSDRTQSSSAPPTQATPWYRRTLSPEFPSTSTSSGECARRCRVGRRKTPASWWLRRPCQLWLTVCAQWRRLYKRGRPRRRWAWRRWWRDPASNTLYNGSRLG